MVRKTLASLTATGIVTYTDKVLHELDGVTFFGGNKKEPAHFKYPNGSKLVVGGMDKATKIMSAEYDLAYVQEAIELTENDWESITTRLRNAMMPYQQIIADTNPDTPTHWLKQRCDRGTTVILESRHEDNPTVWDKAKDAPTERGAAYLSKLDALTGVRYLRLRKGLWVAAEGQIYEGWDPAIHLIDRFDIPAAWPRFWTVDFGFTNPFVWQAWASDPDGRLYRYREIYRTQRLVEDHARDILAATAGEPKPRAIVCDHDAEDRETLKRYLKMSNEAAFKSVSPGIQAVASRMKVAGDGKPRIFFLRDSLVERDPERVEAAKPTCTEEEIPGYVWDTSARRKRGEEPKKDDDHGCDATRYLVAHVDRIGGNFSWGTDPEALAKLTARHGKA